MRPLTAAQLLAAWDRGADQPPVQRALLLLAAACPGESIEVLASTSIGERDTRLLTLREWTFGADLFSIISCPACGELLEMNFRLEDIRARQSEPRESDSPRVPLSYEGYRVTYRLPNSLDLVAAAAASTPEAGRHTLIERCISLAEYQEQTIPANELPSSVIQRVIESMQAADPQADVWLALTCPVCGHAWQTLFDILSYFWSEIEAWAYRTLQEVHRLALAYGWSEGEILALSARRRQIYLAMV